MHSMKGVWGQFDKSRRIINTVLERLQKNLSQARLKRMFPTPKGNTGYLGIGHISPIVQSQEKYDCSLSFDLHDYRELIEDWISKQVKAGGEADSTPIAGFPSSSNQVSSDGTTKLSFLKEDYQSEKVEDNAGGNITSIEMVKFFDQFFKNHYSHTFGLWDGDLVKCLNHFERVGGIEKSLTPEQLVKKFQTWFISITESFDDKLQLEQQQTPNSHSSEAIEIVDTDEITFEKRSFETTKVEHDITKTLNFRIQFSPRVLKNKFKHAADFGIHDRFGKSTVERFKEALERHVLISLERYVGMYQGMRQVAHVGFGRVVWTSTDGVFITGYRATDQQLQRIWSLPVWRKP